MMAAMGILCQFSGLIEVMVPYTDALNTTRLAP
jgi:hypothetical protein